MYLSFGHAPHFGYTAAHTIAIEMGVYYAAVNKFPHPPTAGLCGGFAIRLSNSGVPKA